MASKEVSVATVVTSDKLVSDFEARMSQAGYTEADRPAIIGWETGRIAEGELIRIREGQYGPLMDIRTADGEVKCYGCPTIMESQLRDIPPGTDIAILCLGMRPQKSGREAWDFKVYVRGLKKQPAEPAGRK